MALAPAPDDPGAELKPIQLDPYIVEAKAERSWRARESDGYARQEAVGNLDLMRTADDALPFTILEREQVFRSGAVTLDEFLRRELLDAVAGSSSGQKVSASSFSSLTADSTTLQLRGFGADETVILINGRRLPESVTSGANSQPQAANVNFIPLSLVERVEILPVSASALYSGNPVGGVVNIVLRRDVELTEVTASTTNALSGFDAPQSMASFLHAKTLLGGALRLRLSATFTDVMPPSESELGYIQAQLRAQPDTARMYRATPNVRSANGAPLSGPGSSSRTSVAPGADGTGGRGAFANRAGQASRELFDAPGGAAFSPNSVDFPYGQRQHSTSYYASAAYDVNSWLQVGVDAMLSRTEINRGLDVFPADLKMARNLPANPFGEPLIVSLNEIAPLLGDQYSRAQRELSSVVLGVLVRLPAEWSVSLDSQRARNRTRYRGLTGVDPNRWQSLVDQSLYNPLRDTQRYGPPGEFYDQALIYAGGRGRTVAVGDYGTWDSALRVTNRSLWFPTGSAAINLGGDFRLTELDPYTDEQRFGDGVYAAVPVRWRGRTLQRLSGFGELQAPLLPARWLPRAVRGLDFDLAARYTIADTTQETNLAPTGGLKIGFRGGWALRGSIATTNRLPTPFMSQKARDAGLRTSSVGAAQYVPIYDPLRGERYGIRASDAVNPNLRPESAMTRTVGVIYERGGVHRVRAATDFVDTQKSGELIYLDAQNVLNLEPLFPERVVRAPLEADDTHTAGYVTQVLRGNFNLAWRHSQNVNASFDYAWTACRGGTLDLYWRWVALRRYDRQLLPHSRTIDALHEPDSASPELLPNRMNFGGGWPNRSYGFRLDGRFFDARTLPSTEWRSQGASEIEPYYQFDASVQKELAGWWPWRSLRTSLQAQLRVNNVFGAEPPRYANDPSGAGVQSYSDWRGPTYSLSLRASF
ncbi:TonB-dependent receptor plug [Opitutus terrae PB90-1]|uniref:TonB-dependent receptor plug n=2 Tax=Opitutus terrae TaxID=107709 RepID=B1ZQN5_OPITP|nr:TonB-dependent receptor plug [Opitutus terrae PB90-1]